MNSALSVPKCPQCGAAIPADAPQGLCPRCVLLGAATTTDSGQPVPRTEPPTPDALRAAFPQLEIVELIGRGGMGFVYKARQAKLDRLVALKLLPLELGADPHFAERFHREARALARLNHPSIVAVYDFGVSAGFGYLLMEFVDGVNLRQAMQAGRFTQREALAIVPKICEAIQFAHEQGVLHRDIKPENILLDAHGRVKIADFGIAKLVGDDAPDLTLTQQGARLGTPTYMAPEQIEHPGMVDHRADIYSLGVVFYELLTGELPLGRFAPPSAKADLDARVDDIVMRALAKERELRQQSAGEMRTDVETVASSPRGPVAASLPVAVPAARPWSISQWIGSWLLVIAGVVGMLLVFVAGKTVNDLGMGRSRIQPVELVVFLVVTGAALVCWRLGRRLHGHSVPSGPATALPARPFLLAGVAPAWKPWLLLGFGLGGALLCLQAIRLLLPMVGATAAVVRSGPLPFVLMVLAGSALVAGAWHLSLRRRELLHSLSLHVPETGPALDRWLSRAVLLLLAGLGGGMLIGFGSLFMVVAWQLNGNPGSNGLLLVAVVVIIGLAASWHRRDASPPAPTPAPAWMRRAAWWFFAAGTIALLPTLVSWNASVSVWHTASLLLFTGLALFSAHRGLRRLALVVNWFEVFSGLGGCLALLWFGRYSFPGGITIGVPGITYRPGMGLLLGLLQTAGFVAGLIALHRADARAAFGVTRPSGGRRAWGFVTLAGVGLAVLLFTFIQWKAQRVNFTDWTANPVTMAGAPERSGATLHFTEASTAGSVLLLNIYSEPGVQPHVVAPQFAGAAAMVSQAMVPDRLPTDCLLEPRRGDNGVSDLGGHLLAGNRELTGPGTLRIGFVFPSVELAELAREQVQKDWVGRSRILERPEVMVLFQLQRSKLLDPTTGQPMEEGFLGSLAFNHANPANAHQTPAEPEPPLSAQLPLQGFQTSEASLQIWSNGVPIPAWSVISSVREPGDWSSKSAIHFEFRLEREPHTNQLRLSCKTEGGRSAVSVPVPIPAKLALLALSNAPPHGPLTNGHLRHWLFLPADAAMTVADKGSAPETALWGVSLDVPAPETQLEPDADARERFQQLEREVRPRMMKLIAEAALKELKQRGGEGGEALGLDIQSAEKLLAEAESLLAAIQTDKPRTASADPIDVESQNDARARREHAEKFVKLTEKLVSEGKATAEKLSAAKLALAETEAALRRIEAMSRKP